MSSVWLPSRASAAASWESSGAAVGACWGWSGWAATTAVGGAGTAGAVAVEGTRYRVVSAGAGGGAAALSSMTCWANACQVAAGIGMGSRAVARYPPPL